MSSSTYRVRRATVDDLPHMATLWAAMHFSPADLEKRLTEFQIVESEESGIVGALGIEIVNRHGRLHSESFHNFALADTFRELLWERMQSVATNHGLVRLWTGETAPFWKSNGFQLALSEVLKKLPPPWVAQSPDWLTLALRDEEALQTSLATDFSVLNKEERQRTEELLRRANTAKWIGTALAIIAAIGGIFIALYFILHHQSVLQH
jgi:N-acetylglutamate synthase-like GNAT family acetyltransferase